MLDTLETEISVDEEIIKIKGLKNEYNLCVVNDLHLIADYTEVSEENIETVKDRYENLFKTDSGEKSPKLWTHLPNKVNELNPDLVVFAGDMMDFTSYSNVEILKKGMSKINNDIIYVRADHDYANWYNNAFPQEDVKILHRSIDEHLRNILQRFRRNTSCWN
jgi:predicted MPP superfamily phosphohydrolase